MQSKKHWPEKIVGKLREAGIVIAREDGCRGVPADLGDRADLLSLA